MQLYLQFAAIAYISQLTLGFLDHDHSNHCDLDCNDGQCKYGVLFSKYCQCDDGYAGDRCQTRFHCDLDCGSHGSCKPDNHNNKYCQCDRGYGGDRCQNQNQNHDACSPNPCQHHGHCQGTDSNPYFKCSCNYGYLGDRCQNDHCISSPCQNGAQCHRNYHGPYYYCTCQNGFTGYNCEYGHGTNAPAVPVTDSSPSPQPTSPPSTATTTIMSSARPHVLPSCSKISTVFGIAEKVIESNPGARVCQSGNHTSPEAFVFNNCGFTTTATWKQGHNVMQACLAIPPYTPVATFPGGRYDPATSLTGVFIGCLQDVTGFTFAVQTCDNLPLIDHIVTGSNSFNANPTNFYTIEL